VHQRRAAPDAASTAGKRPRQTIAIGTQVARFFDGPIEPLFPLASSESVDGAEEIEIFLYREVAVERKNACETYRVLAHELPF